MPRPTTYNPKHEEGRRWLRPVRGDPSKAHCMCFGKSFKINNGGIKQIEYHEKGTTHKELLASWSKQMTFSFSKDKSLGIQSPKLTVPYAFEDDVVKAEVLQALHIADANHSFASAASDSQRFAQMFPDSFKFINCCYI